jgi:hypothetical protein
LQPRRGVLRKSGEGRAQLTNLRILSPERRIRCHKYSRSATKKTLSNHVAAARERVIEACRLVDLPSVVSPRTTSPTDAALRLGRARK